jgi:hypothetical protein
MANTILVDYGSEGCVFESRRMQVIVAEEIAFGLCSHSGL